MLENLDSHPILILIDKSQILINLISLVVIILAFIYCLTYSKDQLNKFTKAISILAIGLFIFTFPLYIKHFRQNEPELIISDKGVQIYNKEFLPRSNIKKIYIYRRYKGRQGIGINYLDSSRQYNH